MKTDIEIAESIQPQTIESIAQSIGLTKEDIEPYGHDKAKVSLEAIRRVKNNKTGHLILVTSINPTAAGEGKSTVSIGLADALHRLGKKAMLALREPSLGPVMGIKGGATGGGYSQVIPMADINLHFTGDIHAITAANNTLSALIDNHIHQGNECQIDVRRIQWKRAVDLNDRSLRQVVTGLGGPLNGIPREDGFDITVASEIMAVLCLATSLNDLKKRLSRIVVGYTYERQPVTVADLKAEGVLTVLLKDAIKPNLVQTLEATPAFVHGGPFANIAHGCNSIMATNTALHLADYVVTEAGFGSDLGGEKFMDIVAPNLDAQPEATVIVVTTRALKWHAGIDKEELSIPNISAIEKGFTNLAQHIENMKQFNVPVIVAINAFENDTKEEIDRIQQLCQNMGSQAIAATVWKDGGVGGEELAQAVVEAIQTSEQNFQPLYQDQSIEQTMKQLVTKVYGGAEVQYTPQAQKDLTQLKENGWDKLPVCMAKTPVSLSDNPNQLGRPKDFTITIKQLVPKLGAGFIVAMAGDVLTMPGLPKVPAAMQMDIDEDGHIKGLF